MTKLEEASAKLEEARRTVQAIKAKKAREARANAKNELHKAMFDVADELGGKFSTLRDPNGEGRFDAKDLVFGQPEQARLHHGRAGKGERRAGLTCARRTCAVDVAARRQLVDACA